MLLSGQGHSRTIAGIRTTNHINEFSWLATFEITEIVVHRNFMTKYQEKFIDVFFGQVRFSQSEEGVCQKTL